MKYQFKGYNLWVNLYIMFFFIGVPNISTMHSIIDFWYFPENNVSIGGGGQYGE